MSEAIHPSAPHHLPPFISAPGETDVWMVIMVIILIAAVLGVGVLYFKLHALPEHLAHKGEKVQFQIVAVLALLALFTHNHLYWVAALLLAVIPIPDLTSPLTSIAKSLATIADAKKASPGSRVSASSSRSAGSSKRATRPPEGKEG